jgi:glutamate-1-semialdehyde 2,1-aminomutase
VIESPKIEIAGTHTANPMTMVAGIAQLDVLLSDDTSYPRLSALGDRIRTGVAAAFAEVGVPGSVTGLASMWALHFSSAPPKSIRDLSDVNERAAKVLPSYLRREGVFISGSRLSFVSTAHTDDDIDAAVEGVARALARMKADGFFDDGSAARG